MDLQQIESSLRTAWLRGLEGDAQSYEKVLQSLGAHLRAFLKKRLTEGPQDAEDLVQETLLAVHLKRHTYDPSQPLTAWVYAIARYKLIDHLRTHYRRGALHDDIDDWADVLWAEQDRVSQDAQRDVDQMLETLSEPQRLAIRHVKLDGLSVAETAALVGQSESAVKVNIHRGLKALARKWGVPT
ncbi:MAG: sigma-70 family RNA polymerase sigma factor [Pseudomonadota bacterium]